MKRQKIFRILFVICAIAFLISVGVLIYYWRNYQESANEYAEIAQEAVMVRQDTAESGAAATEEDDGRPADAPALVIDFDALKATNKDTVAWIDFPGQDISYPVVKGTDNSHYLYYTFNGTRNFAGSIFMDSRNGAVMEDSNTIIYGHNMKNGSMFGLLKKYRDESHIQQFPFFDVYTPKGAYRCQIIMAGNVRVRGDYYQVSFENEEQRTEYLKKMNSVSWYQLPEAVSDENVPLVEYIRTLAADDGQTGELQEEIEAADDEALTLQPATDGDDEAADTGVEIEEEVPADDGAPPLVLLSTCTGTDHVYRFVLLGQVTEFYEN